jgi:hypothetical protein
MSGHGDHKPEQTQEQRDLERKLDEQAIDALRAASNRELASRYNVPVIRAIRGLFGIGLKEAADIYHGIMDITGQKELTPQQADGRSWAVVPNSDVQRSNTLERDIRFATDRAEYAEKFAETLRNENASLVRQVRNLEIELEVKGLQEEIAYRQRAIAVLQQEQNEVQNGNQPWVNLDLDDEPF